MMNAECRMKCRRGIKHRDTEARRGEEVLPQMGRMDTDKRKSFCPRKEREGARIGLRSFGEVRQGAGEWEMQNA
jgi:hypothetical protein